MHYKKQKEIRQGKRAPSALHKVSSTGTIPEEFKERQSDWKRARAAEL